MMDLESCSISEKYDIVYSEGWNHVRQVTSKTDEYI